MWRGGVKPTFAVCALPKSAIVSTVRAHLSIPTRPNPGVAQRSEVLSDKVTYCRVQLHI